MKENKLISLTAIKDAFANALSRIVDEDMRQHIIDTFDASIGYVRNCHQPLVFLKGKEEDEYVHLEKVTWLEADGSYTKFHSIGGRTQILTANLASTLRQLEANGNNNFLRIHHSYALNIDYITSRCGNALYIGKQEFTIGRNYKKYVGEQIMGFNFVVCGSRTVAEFVEEMSKSEGTQLNLFVRFLQGNKWDAYLRNLDWKEFARHYNGSEYAKNQYDKKLEKAYAKYK